MRGWKPGAWLGRREWANQRKKEKSFYQEYFKEIDTLHGLQTTPQEREWLLSVPKGEVRTAQVVLYLGCNVLRTSHLVRTVVDVFKLLNVDFVTVGGVSYCCGIQHYQKGDTDAARSIASTTARNFQKFSSESWSCGSRPASSSTTTSWT